MKTLPKEFKKFIHLLLRNSPKNYIPHFFRCQKKGKAPELKYGSWKDSRQRLTPKKALHWLENHGNVGLAGMPSDPLINIDIDDEEKTRKEDLKPTLMARSRSRTGVHAWYFSEDDIPNIPTDDAGEIRAQGQYVITPGSYVPCDDEIEMAGYYTIEEENPVSWVDMDELPEVFLEKKKENERKNNVEPIEFDPKQTNGNHSALFDIEARDVVVREGGSTNPTDRWTALFHNSRTEMNMSLSNQGLLHCWRHEVSHNGLQALAVLSGYMSCQNAGSPHKQSNAGPSMVIKNDGAVFHAWRYAKENGYIPQDDPIPVRAMNYIASRHGICNPSEFEILPKWAYNKVLKIVEGEY